MSATTPHSFARTPSTRSSSVCTMPSITRRNNRRTPMTRSASSGFSRSTQHRTPRSAQLSANSVPYVICAVVEGRGKARGEIGLASIDLSTAQAELSQFSDCSTYIKAFTKLHYFNPVEVIMPSTMYTDRASKLFAALREHYSDLDIVNIPRKFFSEEQGLSYLIKLVQKDFGSVRFEVQDKYYALAAFGALMKYVSHIQNMVFAPNSLKITHGGTACTTMIDATSVKHLELLQSIRDPKNTVHSLFGALDRTKTVSGDVKTITTRQEAIHHLLSDPASLEHLGELLDRFEDTDVLITHMIQIPHVQDPSTAERRIQSLLRLKHNMHLVPQLSEQLSRFSSVLLSAFASALTDVGFNAITTVINTVIHDDATIDQGALKKRNQHIYAVKEGVHGMLDVARRTYSEVVADITELCQQLGEQYDIDLQLEYSAQRSFYFVAPNSTELPNIFQQVSRSKQKVTLLTKELQQMNTRLCESMQEVFTLTNTICSDLYAEIRIHLGCLYRLTEIVRYTVPAVVAEAPSSNFVQPEFSDTLAVKSALHPMLFHFKKNRNQNTMTPNDISGKSVYLRQVALLQILAQLGAHVPAEYACFRVCDQIFTRIGNEDSFETNASTFMVECQELNFILRNATEDSLVIIDELGRGTSPDEGLGICFAACEELIHLRSFTFFATHFSELCRLDMYPGVENRHFLVEKCIDSAGTEKLVYTHQLRPGKSPEEGYGIKLASQTCLPLEVIDRAKIVRDQLVANMKFENVLTRLQKQNCQAQEELSAERAIFKLSTRLLQVAKEASLDRPALEAYLFALRSAFSNK
eukprot:gene2107-5154_t